MALPVWPAALGGFNDQPTIQYGDGVKRTPQDGGPARQSLRYSAVSIFYNGTMTFSESQLATFDTFYFQTIKQAGEFTMEVPGATSTATFRFAAAPQGVINASSRNGNVVPVTVLSISLERLP